MDHVFTKDSLPQGEYRKFFKTRITEAIKMSGTFYCVTSEGNIASCTDGWLAVDSRGYPYPVNSPEFESTYELVGSDPEGTQSPLHEPGRDMIRLLLVTDYDFPTGGIEQFVFELVSRLDERFSCSVLSWTRTVLVPLGTDTQCVEHGDVQAVWSALDAADVVLVVTSFNVRILARLVLDYMDAHAKPLITVVQTSAHSAPQSTAAAAQHVWLSDLLVAGRAIVAVSDDVAEALRATLDCAQQFPPMVVIENAARLRATTAIPRGRDTVGFIGRPVAQKGFPLFERLATANAGRGLRFVANTVSLPPSRTIAEIEVSYNCTDSELLSFFASIDLLVAPYLQADGLPLALQEALNCGVPIIGFDSPGVGDLLRRHGQTVIEPDYSALEAAVLSWQQGTLRIEPPVPGSAVEWEAQVRRYAGLIESVHADRIAVGQV